MVFRDLPIRRKLMTIILGTSGVVLILTCAAFLGYEFITFRQNAIQQLSTIGEIVAANSTGAMAFDNQHDATEILGALNVEKQIVSACLYDKQGRLFSRYPVDSADSVFPASPGPDGYRMRGGHLIGFTPVVQVKGSERFGTLYLESDLSALTQRLRLYGGIALLVIGVSSLVAYVISRQLQQQISRPILALADTARAVADRRDYSVRARKLGEDELGLLTDAINHMLSQIQEQNLALQQAYDDLRQTQLTIMQQERLRALGQMASGIAHDINNAISPASLYTESLLHKEPNLSPRAREYLVTIQRAIDDVAQTVSRLREFYRQREPQVILAPVDVNQLAKQAIELTRARWGDISQHRGILVEMKMELSEELTPVMGAESEIRDALTNLIFNAVDAMPEGGTITVRSQRLEKNPPEEPVGIFACIEVSDTGLGMDEETRRRCLEPFFTTKGERGTGLGLAMVYGTMQRHGGLLQVDSSLGRGTVMRLLFPMPTDPLETPVTSGTPPFPLVPLRLLVIDDDPVLLRSLSQTLEDDGHEVVTAPGGQDGIDTFQAAQKAGKGFDVVITDLGMPYVDGRRVAAAIKTTAPQVPIFLLTGWAQRMAAEGDLPPHVDRILNKPPKLRDLREALAQVSTK